jgi:hypothetical protein
MHTLHAWWRWPFRLQTQKENEIFGGTFIGEDLRWSCCVCEGIHIDWPCLQPRFCASPQNQYTTHRHPDSDLLPISEVCHLCSFLIPCLLLLYQIFCSQLLPFFYGRMFFFLVELGKKKIFKISWISYMSSLGVRSNADECRSSEPSGSLIENLRFKHRMFQPDHLDRVAADPSSRGSRVLAALSNPVSALPRGTHLPTVPREYIRRSVHLERFIFLFSILFFPGGPWTQHARDDDKLRVRRWSLARTRRGACEELGRAGAP